MNIRTKLAVFPIALTIIMLLISLSITLTISTRTVKNQTENLLLTTVKFDASFIEDLLNSYKRTTEMIATGDVYKNILDDKLEFSRQVHQVDLRNNSIIDSYPGIERIRILNKQGVIIASSNEDIGIDNSDKAIFLKGREDIYMGDIHKSEFTGNFVISISTPIYVRDLFSGVMIINFNVEKQLFEIVENRIGMGKTGELFLANKNGYMISPSRFVDNTILETKINFEQSNAHFLEHLEEIHYGGVIEKPAEYINYRGIKVLGSHCFIPEMQWFLIAEIETSELQKPIKEQALLVITIFMVLLTITIIIGILISKGVLSAIIKLNKGTNEIIKGNLDYKIGIESKDEIGQFARTFDKMTSRLKTVQNKLGNYTEDLESTVKERTKELKKQFTKSEKQRIATLVIMNDLNASTKKLKAEITERKRAEQIQKVLYNISNAVITTDNLEELIHIIKNELGTIIDTTNFYIALFNSETDSLSLPFFVDEKDKHTFVPAGKTLTKYVIDTKKSLLANIADKKRLVNEGRLENVGSLSKLWLGVPLKIKGKVTGVLAVQSYTDENAYNESDMEMLEFIADQVRISIERKKAEQNLITALKKATESDRLKSAFLAAMSHELRTPLNAIIGFSDLVDESLPVETIVGFAKTINLSGNHLLSIINDLFDITLIESGETKIQKEEILLQLVLNNVQDIIEAEQQKTNKGNIVLNMITPLGYSELVVSTDESKLKQVLINLLKNALKFTHEGHIDYGYSIETEQGKPILKFFVKDTGIGIAKDKQELIFDVFRQVEDSLARAYGGAGIGLSIARKLTEILGGEIWVESEKEKGSTFYFTIPFDEHKEISIPIIEEVVKENSHKEKTILVVEDDELSFKFIEVVLENPEVNIIWAKDGEESVKLCKENTDIDLILMDINMPVMNGYEATKKIKQFRPELPIIAQTAYAIAGDHEKALAAGCNDYISKPIKRGELLKKIRIFL